MENNVTSFRVVNIYATAMALSDVSENDEKIDAVYRVVRWPSGIGIRGYKRHLIRPTIRGWWVQSFDEFDTEENDVSAEHVIMPREGADKLIDYCNSIKEDAIALVSHIQSIDPLRSVRFGRPRVTKWSCVPGLLADGPCLEDDEDWDEDYDWDDTDEDWDEDDEDDYWNDLDKQGY